MIIFSVLEYIYKFDELSRIVKDIVSIDSVKMSRFFKGLNVKIRKGVEKYSDLKDMALEYERIMDKEESAYKRKFGNDSNHNKKKFIAAPSIITEWKCQLCGEDHEGHCCSGWIICFVNNHVIKVIITT